MLVSPGATSACSASSSPVTGATTRTLPSPVRTWTWVPIAEEFLTGAAAAGVARLGVELPEITALAKAHGHAPLLAALERAVAFRRWRAADVRSILAAGTGVPVVTPPGADLVLTLPTVPTRSLADYAIVGEGGGSAS
jgi:hypothetical protein